MAPKRFYKLEALVGQIVNCCYILIMDDPPKPPEVRISRSVIDRLELILDITLGVFLGLMLFAYVAAKASWQWPNWIIF